jgi:hypothetical protein
MNNEECEKKNETEKLILCVYVSACVVVGVVVNVVVVVRV